MSTGGQGVTGHSRDRMNCFQPQEQASDALQLVQLLLRGAISGDFLLLEHRGCKGQGRVSAAVRPEAKEWCPLWR